MGLSLAKLRTRLETMTGESTRTLSDDVLCQMIEIIHRRAVEAKTKIKSPLLYVANSIQADLPELTSQALLELHPQPMGTPRLILSL